MENEKYLKILKSQLRSMDHNSRLVILNEIKSSIDDAPEARLEDRFGSVYQLAAQYLEDMPEHTTFWDRISITVKWILLACGVAFLGVVGFLIWVLTDPMMSGEEFDYSDLNAPEINKLSWVEVDFIPDHIELYQSDAIIYTGDFQELSYACSAGQEGIELEEYAVDDGPFENFKISNSKCFLRLPDELNELTAFQSSVYVTDLRNDLDINLEQSSVILALNEKITIDDDASACDNYAEDLTEGGMYTLKLSGYTCTIRD